MTEFIMNNGGKSLVSRIYGLYMVIYPGMEPIYVCLQSNNIKISPDNQLQSMFDLKGSKFNRKILDAEEIKKSQLSQEPSQKLGKREKQKL